MTKAEFMQGIHILIDSYNQIFSKEKLQMWWENFKDFNKDEYIKAINILKSKNKFMPNIAEIKSEIMVNQNSFSNNCNLNSSYWYTNLKYFCDKNDTPYYDITKGPDYPLPPFKD